MPPPTEQTGSWARGPWRRLLLPELREAVDIHLAENADILERISRAMECVEGDDRDLDACGSASTPNSRSPSDARSAAVTETIDSALCDRQLLGAALDDPDSWQTWFAALRAAFGLELSREHRRIFAAISGGRAAPTKRVREFWCLVGRKGGKSRMAAAIACYIALFGRFKLARGEQGLVLVLAMSMDQAKVVFGYCYGFLASSPVLAREIESTTATEIRLKNGIVIATHANSFRSVRGRTLCACVFDEVAYWRDSIGAVPDIETYTAIIPSLLTTKGMLIGISSTYRRAGLLYSKYERFFGTDDADTLVVKGGTTTFNRRCASPIRRPRRPNGTVNFATIYPACLTAR